MPYLVSCSSFTRHACMAFILYPGKAWNDRGAISRINFYFLQKTKYTCTSTMILPFGPRSTVLTPDPAGARIQSTKPSLHNQNKTRPGALAHVGAFKLHDRVCLSGNFCSISEFEPLFPRSFRGFVNKIFLHFCVCVCPTVPDIVTQTQTQTRFPRPACSALTSHISFLHNYFRHE